MQSCSVMFISVFMEIWSSVVCSWQMVIVLHTCLILSLPLEMCIIVFHSVVDNGTRGWYGIKRSLALEALLFSADIKIAPSSLRCIWNIPDVSSSNYSFLSCEKSQMGVTTPQPAGSQSLRQALSHIHVVILCPAWYNFVLKNECTAPIHFFPPLRLNYILYCLTYQVTCSAVTVGDHADQKV